MVVVGHGYVLTGAGATPRIGGIPLHTLGVCIFFALSGYLIAGSWQRSPSAGRYLAHRVLRIFPALIVVVLLTVFMLGPVATTLTARDYFASATTWRYLTNLALIGQYELPGVFDGPGHTRTAVNGSLWTLGVEFSCYVALLALMLVTSRLRIAGSLRTVMIIGAAVITAAAALASPGLPWFGLPAYLDAKPALEMAVFFFVGAAIRLLVPPRGFGMAPAIAALVVWLIVGTVLPELSWLMSWPLLSYAVITIGRANIPFARSAGRFGDLSYGVYLWAYPIQQLTIQAFGPLALPLSLLITTAASLLVALASWHLIEKRALALKDGAWAPWQAGTAPA